MSKHGIGGSLANVGFVLLAAAASAGCCSAYKQAVAADVANLPETSRVFYEQCVANPCGNLTPELVAEHIRKDATLACLVDTDRGLSSADQKSLACRCAEGAEIGACKPWLGIR